MPYSAEKNRARVARQKRRKLHTEDYLNSVIKRGKPDPVHKMLARMAG